MAGHLRHPRNLNSRGGGGGEEEAAATAASAAIIKKDGTRRWAWPCRVPGFRLTNGPGTFAPNTVICTHSHYTSASYVQRTRLPSGHITTNWPHNRTDSSISQQLHPPVSLLQKNSLISIIHSLKKKYSCKKLRIRFIIARKRNQGRLSVFRRYPGSHLYSRKKEKKKFNEAELSRREEDHDEIEGDTRSGWCGGGGGKKISKARSCCFVGVWVGYKCARGPSKQASSQIEKEKKRKEKRARRRRRDCLKVLVVPRACRERRYAL